MGSRLAGILSAVCIALFVLCGVGWFRSSYAYDELTATLVCNARLLSGGGAIEFRLLAFPQGAPTSRFRWYHSEYYTSEAFAGPDPYDHPPYVSSPIANVAIGRFATRIERWTAPN